MTARIVLLLGLILLPRLACAQLSFGSASFLTDDWSFALGDDSRARAPSFDDGAWKRVSLPHDWSAQAKLSPELASATGYLPGGIAWYRKKLSIPAAAGGERVYLYFEGIYNRSEVYLNGHLLGKRPNGYVSFYYDATPYVRFDRENTIAVRVDHSRSADSRWYTGSGIYRDVYLVRAGPVHLAPWGVVVQPRMSDKNTARIRVQTQVQNATAGDAAVVVQHELIAVEGKVIATAHSALTSQAESVTTDETELEVADPRLWNVRDPYLYRVRTTLTRDGRKVDETITRTGVRTFAFDPNKGYFLNGVSMKMKGVCLHHDAGVLGAAVPREVWRYRLQTLKGLGCNAVRTSHNPQAPDLYDLCDELGLLVLNEAFDEWEFPKRKWLKGWNVGEPGFEGSYEFFEEWSGRDLEDMVRRDRNHPSIFAWSIGNEVDYPNDPYSHPVLDGTTISQPMFGGYKPEQPHANRLGAIAKRLAAVVKKHDPTRPVTAALAGVVMSNETEYPAALDLAGYNYTEDRYTIDHQKYPQRVIYGSENRHSLDAWKAVEDNEHIFGQFLWTGIDYLGEAGPWPSRGSTAGLLDLTGAVKPRGRFREALWSDKPVLHLGTMRVPKEDRDYHEGWPIWNYPEGTAVRVFCYTNAAKAGLVLNGKRVGEEKERDAATGVVSWDIPFAPGKLEAVAVAANGAEVARTAIQTADTPARLRLLKIAGDLAQPRGVALIEVQVVDNAGVPIMDTRLEVTCAVEGPARLLGLESGNQRDMSDYSDHTHAVYHGRIVAYLQSTGGPGGTHVRFRAPGLPDAILKL